jgi:peptidoglycan/LPS O-acetylase OafA/YrhL
VRALIPWAIGGGAAAVALLVLLRCVSDNPYAAGGGPLTLHYTLFAALFGVVLVWAVTASPAGLSGRFWNSRPLRFFGKYSYGMYVFQLLLVPALLFLFPPAQLNELCGSVFLGRMLYLVAATGATLAVSLLSWHLYEKHFLKLKRYFPEPKKRAPTADARGTPGSA